MNSHTLKKVMSILMESPLYQTLTIKERHALITTMGEQYPFLTDSNDESQIGYESSWTGVIQDR